MQRRQRRLMTDDQTPGPQVNPLTLLIVTLSAGLIFAGMRLGTALVIFN
jgi:hypothetical protein